MKHRHSHTTKQNKAKCLAYRDGKRCGRVAKFVVDYTDHQGHHHQAACQECKNRVTANGGKVVTENAKGFTVCSAGGFSGCAAREYVPIE